MYLAEELVAVDHAPVAVLDDHAIADLALRGDEQPHLLPGRERDILVADEALEPGRSHAASRDAVLVEVDDVAVPDQNAALLVAVGQEEVLSVQPPVEEGAVGRLVHHAQVSGLPDLEQRTLGRGHEPVFRVVIDENLLPVAHLVRERRVAVREKHLVVLLVREIDAVFRRAADGKGLCATCLKHDSFFGILFAAKVRFISPESKRRPRHRMNPPPVICLFAPKSVILSLRSLLRPQSECL